MDTDRAKGTAWENNKIVGIRNRERKQVGSSVPRLVPERHRQHWWQMHRGEAARQPTVHPCDEPPSLRLHLAQAPSGHQDPCDDSPRAPRLDGGTQGSSLTGWHSCGLRANAGGSALQEGPGSAISSLEAAMPSVPLPRTTSGKPPCWLCDRIREMGNPSS